MNRSILFPASRNFPHAEILMAWIPMVRNLHNRNGGNLGAHALGFPSFFRKGENCHE